MPINTNKPRQVAIVGQSFRFPGGPPSSYWGNLLAGRDLVTSLDPARFAAAAFGHPDPHHAGTSYSFAAGVIDHVGDFDAAFFGMSPREAALVDPQQRLLLEMGWEALENAGIPPRTLRGSDAGVYIGIASADYSYRLIDDLAALDAPAATGNAGSIAANRLSWFFDLHGPSMAIDTACSSSLVAFHQACRSIVSGESSLALVGGVSLLLHPYVFVSFAKASMLSRQGRCRVFDASADGYVRAEGGGILVLKDLEQALADGNTILAVVAGSGVNADGYTQGLMVPNATAQAALLERVYAEAGLQATDLNYLEAHGTGTAVGDPIEAHAIGAALGMRRPASSPLPVGSVKSTLGHLEAASGIAGLVKALHCLIHRVVPATIGIEQINPQIPVAEWNLDIVTSNRALPADGQLVVGVNSFGFGGANAHVVLTSYEDKKPAAALASAASLPLLISAHDAAALRANAAQMAGVLEGPSPPKLQDLAYQLNFRRDQLAHRVLVQGSAIQVARALRRFSTGADTPLDLLAGRALPGAVAVALVYSGNGAQWEGMGRRLLATSPLFREAIEEVDALFQTHTSGCLLDELLGLPGENRYAATEIAQPTLFAVQVGVTRLLRAQGVVPTAVTGHSVGEIAAAWAAGALTLEAAVEVIYHRSRLQGTTRGSGAMSAVGLGAAALQDLITSLGLDDQLCLAATNSSCDCTLAGAPAALTQLEATLAQHEIFYRRLKLDYAFHSPLMDPIEAPLRSALSHLTGVDTPVAFYSAVTGSRLSGTALNAHYWWQNIRQPVAFAAALSALQADGAYLLLEIGPHPVLNTYLRQAVQDHGAPGLVLSTLTRQDDSAAAVWRAGAQAIVAGATPDWSRFFPRPRAPVTLPNYAWQRQHYWHPVTPATLGLLARHALNPLLGHALAQHQGLWENALDTQRLPLLADHAVRDAVVFPAAGFAELALAVAQGHQSGEWLTVLDLDLRAPLLLGRDNTRLVRTQWVAQEGQFSVRSRAELTAEDWTLHAQAEVPQEGQSTPPAVACSALPTRAPDFDHPAHYALAAQAGLHYGPAFQRVAQGWVTPDAVQAVLRPDPHDADFLLSPMALDAAFQLVVQLLAQAPQNTTPMLYLPVRIARLVCARHAAAPAAVSARCVRRSTRTLSADFQVLDAAGNVLASAEGVDFRRVPSAHDQRGLRYLDWRLDALPAGGQRAAAPDLLPVLQSRVAELARHLAQEGVGQRYTDEVEPLLDSLCQHYTLQALSQLADASGYVPNAALQMGAAATPACAAWQAALLALVQAEGAIAPAPDGWQLRDPDAQWAEPLAAICGSLLAEYPEYFELVQSVAQTGLQLPALLAGEPAPAAGTLATLLTRVRGVSTGARLGLGLNLLLDAPADSPPRRLLEITAEGPLLLAAAGLVPPTLRGSYRFASTSARALEQAASRWPWLVSELVAATTPPLATHDCDYVLLSDDATSRTELDAMLALARASLAPGGCLLVVGQQPTRWIDFVFGAAPDWWEGGASRQQDLTAWRQQLTVQGFTLASAVALDSGNLAGGWLLLAQTPATALQPPVVAAPAHWLLLVDATSQPLAAALTQQLMANGATVTSLEVTTPAALAAQLPPLNELAGLVQLAGLAHAGSPPTADALLASQTQRCAVAAALTAAIDAGGTPLPCWLVTRNALGNAGLALADAALWGFGRTLMNEAAQAELRLLDIGALPDAEAARALADELRQPGLESELLLGADGQRWVPRLTLVGPPQLPPAAAPLSATLVVEQPGALDSLHWQQQPALPLAEDELEIAVETSALNFRDLMLALGLLPPEAVDQGFAGTTLGLEFAGTVLRVGPQEHSFRPGDRVLGYGPSSFAMRVRTKRWAVAVMPPELSFEAAATIPTAFVTAWYALKHLANLQPGEGVLIHGAAGGVGLAAIQIARLLGAEVYATAGTPDKRDFLRLLGVEHCYDSRSLHFAEQILAATGGRGVAVVLNSLSGAAITRSLEVLQPFGRFIELGKRDFFANTRVGLRPFRNNLSYFGVDVDQLMRLQPALARQLLDEVMGHFQTGSFTPLPYRVFGAERIVEAFRHMQSARHIGKIVVTYPLGAPLATPAPAPPLTLNPAVSYLVTGGLSGLGLATAQWLGAHGARHLVLCGRSPTLTAAAAAALAQLAQAGVAVLATPCDVTDYAALAAVFDAADARGAPVRGVIHAATHYHDGWSRDLSPAQIRAVLAPKIAGAINLARLTEARPLDFFVLFSSATTLFGNPGQSSYVAANHWLESLARARRAAGLPATCLSFGPIEDAGYLARHTGVRTALTERLGGRALRVAEALAVLGTTLATGAPGNGVLPFQWPALARVLRSAHSPKFSEVARMDGDGADLPAAPGQLREALLALPHDELQASVIATLKKALGQVLNVAPADLETTIPVHTLGLDSLMGVELAMEIETHFGIRVPEMGLGEQTVAQLAARVVTLLRQAASAAHNTEDEHATVLAAQVDLLSKYETRDAAARVLAS